MEGRGGDRSDQRQYPDRRFRLTKQVEDRHHADEDRDVDDHDHHEDDDLHDQAADVQDPGPADADRHGGPECREEKGADDARGDRGRQEHGMAVHDSGGDRAETQPEHRQSVVLVGVLEPPPQVCEQAEYQGQRHRTGDGTVGVEEGPDQAGRRDQHQRAVVRRVSPAKGRIGKHARVPAEASGLP